MAKGEKKISISVFDKIAKENFNTEVTEQWFGVDVHITPSLGLTSVLEFVSDTVASCFSEEGKFMPEIMDFAIKSNILTRYANFSLPDNLEHRYALIYTTDAVDFVMKRINRTQLHEIISSVNRQLDCLCDSNVAELQKRMNDLLNTFETIQEQTGKLFENVTASDVQKLIGAAAGASLDEERVVHAFLEEKNRQDTDGETE